MPMCGRSTPLLCAPKQTVRQLACLVRCPLCAAQVLAPPPDFGSSLRDPVSDPLTQRFYLSVDSSFGNGQTVSVAVRSTFRFALPIQVWRRLWDAELAH